MKKLVIASNNPGKLREIDRILQPLGLEVLPQSAFHIPDADEPYCTFIENCLTKARHASELAGLPALADDSGICVDVLNGAPGVYSARFAGEPKSDQRNNEKMIELLKHETNRKAHYYCVIILVRHPHDPQPIIAEGSWHGEIIDTPRGSGGFGYDPYFLVSGLNQTGAELPADVKNGMSHRGKALAELVEKLKLANLIQT